LPNEKVRSWQIFQREMGLHNCITNFSRMDNPVVAVSNEICDARRANNDINAAKGLHTNSDGSGELDNTSGDRNRPASETMSQFKDSLHYRH
jgi:hypothetical protein